MADSDRILITRPQHDEITYYLKAWSKKLIEHAKENNLKVTDLDKENANQEEFESYMKTLKPETLILNGHGNSKIVGGYKDQKLLAKDENDHLTEEKRIYARTCESGKKLGKSCVEKGSKGFIGYEGKFVLALDTRSNANPQEDKLATPIMEASNEAPKALIEGKNPKEAYQRAQEKYDEKIQKALANYSLGNNQVLAALTTNKKNQILHLE